MWHIAGKTGRTEALYILRSSSKPAQLSRAVWNAGSRWGKLKVSVKNSQLLQEQFVQLMQLFFVDTCMCPLKVLAPFADFNQT